MLIGACIFVFVANGILVILDRPSLRSEKTVLTKIKKTPRNVHLCRFQGYILLNLKQNQEEYQFLAESTSSAGCGTFPSYNLH
ncbi:hypothetical protein GDO86_016440 [Hymenochirus boettgeri]|uniref:Uncharacterized protein n=1 Tax=Hymenochirus boettgeri TaxID=247094 RepID=A0A8T2K2F8_9PIPI|nr:hypothetical protein GDO86_016440 [Hymenochirus boettgeri]